MLRATQATLVEPPRHDKEAQQWCFYKLRGSVAGVRGESGYSVSLQMADHELTCDSSWITRLVLVEN